MGEVYRVIIEREEGGVVTSRVGKACAVGDGLDAATALALCIGNAVRADSLGRVSHLAAMIVDELLTNDEEAQPMYENQDLEILELHQAAARVRLGWDRFDASRRQGGAG